MNIYKSKTVGTINKITSFLKERWDFLIFLLLSLTSLSFLIFQRGVWLYLDVGAWPKNGNEVWISLRILLSSWSNFAGTFLGYDAYHIEIQRGFLDLIVLLVNYVVGSTYSQAVFYFLFYCLGFIFARRFFKILNKDNYKIITLFFCFNPFSIWLLCQSQIFAIYFTLPVYFYSLYLLINSPKYKYILANILSLLIIIYYARIVGLLAIFLLFLCLFFKTEIIKSLKVIGFRKIAQITLFYVATLSSYVFALALSFLEQTTSQFNYLQPNILKDFFYSYSTQPLSFLIAISEGTNNFAESAFFYYLNTFSTLVLLISIFFLKEDQKKIKLRLLSLWTALFAFSVLISGKLLDIKTFGVIYTDVLPILYKNLRWVTLFTIAFVVLYVVASKRISWKHQIIFLCFIVLSILPILTWEHNILLQKISVFDDSFTRGFENTPTIFYPYDSSVYRSNYPYPLRYYTNPTFTPLFTRNPRFVNDEHLFFYNNVLDLEKDPYNNFLFGLQDYLVFKDVKEWKFLPQNQIKTASSISNYFTNNANKYELIEENEDFDIYKYQNYEEFNYLIYTPKQIVSSSPEQFSDLVLNPKDRVLVLDIGNLVSSISSQELTNAMYNNSSIEYKYSLENSSKYYVKISRTNVNDSVLLYLSQSFHPDWRIYFVNEQDWIQNPCISKPQTYQWTVNSTCQYKDSVIDFDDLKLWLNPHLNEANHFRGNFLGNAFFIGANDIPQDQQDKKDIYLVIYFEKQNYYMLSLFLIVSTLFLLTGLALKERFYKKDTYLG